MPLARIITDVADDSLELTMQLRARGFQVETVAPGETSTTPADLEVRLEECAPEDVLTQADTSEADDLWVFVAPGALDESARPMRTMPQLPRVVEAKSRSALLFTPRTESAIVPPAPASIDRLDEDLILAELREFRPPIAAEGLTESNAESVDAFPHATNSPLPEQTGLPVSEVPCPPAVMRSDDVASEENVKGPAPVSAAWLTQLQIPTIPIAPQPVANFVIIPAPEMVRKQKPTRRFNFRPWKVAFISTALVTLAGLLIGRGRPNDAPNPAQSAMTWMQARPSPALRQVPAPGWAQRRPNPPASGQVHASPVKMPVARPRAPLVAKNSRKVPHHSRGDGLIAEDTVVFYDRKPSTPRAKAQAQPGMKQHSDQN
jgi:hypothetical protein